MPISRKLDVNSYKVGFIQHHFSKDINKKLGIVKSGAGFTLIELLVSITIIGILSVSSFVYFKSLTRDKVLLKAVDSVQTLIRLAQSNATSGFNCGNTDKPGKWIVTFSDSTHIYLKCQNSVTVTSAVLPATPAPSPASVKTLTLEDNIQVDSVSGSSSCSPSLPSSVSFLVLNGKVTFTNDDIGNTETGDACIKNSSTLTITLKDTLNTSSCAGSDFCKSFTISNGGAINVQ